MNNISAKRAFLTRGISAVAVAAALMVAAPSYAQSSTSTLQGHVDGASADSTVTATDTFTGQVVTVHVGSDGNYFIPGLRPSSYHVAVSGGGEAQDVIIPVSQTVTVDLSASNTTIVVTGGRNRTEVRTAQVTTNVTPEQIENLPQNDRNFLNFAALAPGVSVSPTGGARQVQAGAVSSAQTNVFVDGLSLKNPINHGGVVGQNFSRGNPFPQLAVQEFAVDTQNFKAEYEQAGSAIITAVTKTGGDKFHGDIFGEWQPKAFIGQPFFDRGHTPKPDYNRWQYGGDIGGPIIKDLLHFYFAFEGTNQTLPSASVNLTPGATDLVPASIASQYNRSYAQSFDQKLYFGKLTLFASADDTMNASAFIRRENNLSDYGGNAVPSHGHILQSDVEVYQFDWTHRGGNWLNQFTGAYNIAANGTPRVTSGPQLVLERQQRNSGVLQYEGAGAACGSAVTAIPCVSTGNEDAFLGANSFYQNDHQRIVTLQDHLSYYAGKHSFKIGAKVSFTTLQRTEDSQSNGSYYFLDSAFTDLASSTPFAARVSTVAVQPATAKDTQIGLFVQDDWTVNDHLTVNAGLRWDYETNAKNEKFVTPANVAAALRAYQPWQAAGINPEDYISNGHNRHPEAAAFQPRLGISYDVNGDRDLVLFGGAGRYFDRPLFIELGIETVKNLYQSVTTLSFCNPTGGTFTTLTPCASHVGQANFVAYNPGLKDVTNLRAAAVATGLGGDVWLLNNNMKLPFSDEFDIGIRKRFGQIQTSLTFSHIRSHNIFQFVRGNRLPSGQYTPAGDQWIDDGFPAAGQLPGFNGKLDIGSNGGKADYNAIYLTAEKPFNKNSRWGFTSALTLQLARTNDAQELNADEFYNGPRQDAYGWEWVNGVEKWRFVGTGIVRGPWHTTLSATATLSSGPSFGSVIFGLPNTPPTACCYGNMGGVYFPHTFLGYKNIDMRIAKTVTLPWGHELTLDFQAYNVFDWVNRNYSSWGAGSRSYNGTTISDPTFLENGTVGNARSFQVSAKYSF